MSIRTPAQVLPGQPFDVDVSFRNTGKTDWAGRRLFRVEADHPRWNVIPESIGRTVYAPKTIASFTLEAIAPITPGTYPLVIRMTHRRNPFGSICQKNVRVGQGSSSSSSSSSGIDLAVTAAPPASVLRGSTSSLGLTVRNNGSDTANAVYVVVQLPTGTTVAANLPNTCTADSSFVACSLGSINRGASRSVSIPLTAAPVSGCTPQSATLNVETYAREVDSLSDNNRTITSTTLTCPVASTADFSIGITGPTGIVRPNTVATYALVSRMAPVNGTAPSATVTLTHVAGLQFNAARTSPACRSTGATTVRCDVQGTTSESERLHSVSFDVPTTLACGTVLNATAVITSNVPDPTMANNTANSTSIAVTCGG